MGAVLGGLGALVHVCGLRACVLEEGVRSSTSAWHAGCGPLPVNSDAHSLPACLPRHPHPSSAHRTQEAAARARQLSVQRVQQLPALRQARAATQPASNAAALRKLATHPAFPAPPSLAAALAQAAASVRSPSAIATLQAGLESSQGHDLPPLGGAGRPGWQEKRQAATEVHVDAVYRQIQVCCLGFSALGDGGAVMPCVARLSCSTAGSDCPAILQPTATALPCPALPHIHIPTHMTAGGQGGWWSVAEPTGCRQGSHPGTQHCCDRTNRCPHRC